MSTVESNSAGLVADGVTVRYGGLVANENISLEVRPGEIVGLIGPNGAGKTTFVDAITGFTACEGTVALNGARIDGLLPHQRRRTGLARTWQSGELFANLSVAENILVAARTTGVRTVLRDLVGRRQRSGDVVERALEVVGLKGVARTMARELSLGQQKLVGVARALVGNCSVVLLDEPAAGLDSAESQELAARLRTIADSGPGLLLIDHDMSLVLSVCDAIYVLEFGKLIFSGTPAEARQDPQVINAYLGVPMESSHA